MYAGKTLSTNWCIIMQHVASEPLFVLENPNAQKVLFLLYTYILQTLTHQAIYIHTYNVYIGMHPRLAYCGSGKQGRE